MNTVPDVSAHQHELRKALHDIQKDFVGQRKTRYPTRYSPSIWSELSPGGRVDPWCTDYDKKNNDPIRKIHDFYGWMAKHDPSVACKSRSRCSGALYRTCDFMKLKFDDRDGCRDSRLRNIHIEHTVPVKVLYSILGYTASDAARRLASPEALHWFLMEHSVCTAFTYHEKERSKPAGVARDSSCAFDSTGERRHDFPFRRYRPLRDYSISHGYDFRIFNTVSGPEVNIDFFTFADHAATLQQASLVVMDDLGKSLYKLEAFDRSHWSVRQ